MGLAKWGHKEWIGKLYPKGTKESAFQIEYQKHFNTIEFNTTHYKLSSEEDITRWLEKAQGSDLKFYPKVYQGISHFGSLVNSSHNSMSPSDNPAFSLVSAFAPLKFTLMYNGVFPVLVLFLEVQGK